MKTVVVPFVVALGLCGCAPGPRPAANVGYFDLGPPREGAARGGFAGLRGIEVFAPSWLDSAALQYRQGDADSQKRRNYAENRWVAPPAELLAHALRPRLLAAPAGGACKLRVDLDEFIQVFDSPASSRARIDVRVQLLAPGGAELLGRQAFSVEQPAASADAAGGARALAAAVEALSARLGEWLGGLDRASVQGSNIGARCRS